MNLQTTTEHFGRSGRQAHTGALQFHVVTEQMDDGKYVGHVVVVVGIGSPAVFTTEPDANEHKVGAAAEDRLRRALSRLLSET